jgi:predicted ATPase/class 3 adenylate cyclase
LGDAWRWWRGPALADNDSEVLRAEAVRLDELRWRALERRIDADLNLGRHGELVAELEALVAAMPLREGFAGLLMVALYRCGRQADALGVYRRTREMLAEELGIDPGPALRALELAILNQSAELQAPGGAEISQVGVVLPAGTVTFLFTDIEGSTILLSEIGGERYGEELAAHRVLVRDIVAANQGVEVGTEGDAVFAAFVRASAALAAAGEIQKGLVGGPVRVRMGVHTGEPLVIDGDYVGLDVHRAARICAAAHGGQVLVSQATRDLSDADLKDLGEFRLKDLAGPERLFQLGTDNFPPPRALGGGNLPVQPTPLLGRQQELADLVGLIRDHRLVTLTGPGGSGKTRLALQVAAEMADEYRDGVWWVPLAAISDLTLVVPTIARSLGVAGDVGEYLTGRSLLLLVDNMEQVLDAGPQLGGLLGVAPAVSLLVTSRERLAIAGEQEYPVPPLDEPAAAELFVARARQVKPDFEPDSAVRDICRRLDGLPLALELASTRVKVMSTKQILMRLEHRFEVLASASRDAPARHITMRAAIDWSYDLLSAPEQNVFRCLGVFAGSFELDAAGGVGDAGLDQLQSLVDKSLVRAAADRFFLLETTREYALERLDQAGETDDLRRRHADWYFQLAQVSRRALTGQIGRHVAPQGPWVERLRSETDNFRAALAWAMEHDVNRGVELLVTLARSWEMAGQFLETLRWCERAFASPAVMDPDTRAWGMGIYGRLLTRSGQHERAEKVLQEGLNWFRRTGDLAGEADVLIALGNVWFHRRAPEQAVSFDEQAADILRRVGDGTGAAPALNNLGSALMEAGRYAEAEAALEEAARLATSSGNRYFVTNAVCGLGDIALDQRNPTKATIHYREALRVAVGLGAERNQAYPLAGLACTAALQGDLVEAGRLWTIADSLDRKLEFCLDPIERQRYDTILIPLHHEEAFLSGIEAARSTSLQQVLDELLTD